MYYSPKPIDTTNISLSIGLFELMEKIAENVHDVWAMRRITEGWSYGPVRDDIKKEKPCLVSYDELPESEKNMIGILRWKH